jgi:hypothetical protein
MRKRESKMKKPRIKSLYDEDIDDPIDIFDIGDSETALVFDVSRGL